MKHFLITLTALVSFSAGAQAFTGCTNADGSFTVSIYEGNPVQALILDKSVSVAPASYTCSKSSMTHKGDKLVAYGCVGGNMGEDRKVAVYVNESDRLANYHDLANDQNDKSNLECQFSK